MAAVASAAARKGAILSAVGFIGKEGLNSQGNLPKKDSAACAGTTAAALHALTKHACAMRASGREASVPVAAVATKRALADVDMPDTAKNLLAYGAAGVVILAQNGPKFAPQCATILAGFGAGYFTVEAVMTELKKTVSSDSTNIETPNFEEHISSFEAHIIE